MWRRTPNSQGPFSAAAAPQTARVSKTLWGPRAMLDTSLGSPGLLLLLQPFPRGMLMS